MVGFLLCLIYVWSQYCMCHNSRSIIIFILLFLTFFCLLFFQKTNGISSSQLNGHVLDGGSATTFNIVNDLFLAQFRSTIECPNCTKRSCKLDPFLLVPLPISEKYKIPVYLIAVPFQPPQNLVKIAVMMSTADRVLDLRHRIAARSMIPPEQVCISFFKFEVWESYKFWYDKEHCMKFHMVTFYFYKWNSRSERIRWTSLVYVHFLKFKLYDISSLNCGLVLWV